MVRLSGCQTSGFATVFIMCTRIPSKIAPHNVCRGRESASSSSVIAGYFAFLIGCNKESGTLLTALPSLSFTLSLLSNMNASQAFHHISWSFKSFSYMLITVGRNTADPLAVVIVFVIRSGMDARRLLPRVGSLRNPSTMVRFEKSDSQYDLTDFQPASTRRLSSFSNMVGVNTSETGTSLSPGFSKNSSTFPMRSSYAGFSGIVSQYSNGLLLIAATLNVVTCIRRASGVAFMLK
mmetsp:Transcript_36221/g.75342  ORF Transcript_36221/g.75342 Transcript_36221/m.75342 type:complete len:236 (+) Transcript_36221:902-1609(+)